MRCVRRGILRTRSLKQPVVSVGSISSGGAGKTPMVIALAKLLDERGWTVDVLTRGYGRKGKGVELVSGEDAKRFGDEPVLIARATKLPVWVGKSRFAAGRRAEKDRLEGDWGGKKKQIPPPRLRSGDGMTKSEGCTFWTMGFNIGGWREGRRRAADD